MNLNEHIIVEEYDTRAIFVLHTLPTHGNLLLNGAIMKKGDKFTQANLRDGTLQYQHTRNEGSKEPYARDEFKFKVPLNDKDFLLPTTERSPCLPATGVPKDGIFTFPIIITVLPAPVEIRNREITIMEDATYCLTRGDLFYSSDTKEVDKYFKKPDVVVQKSESQVFHRWKRFVGPDSYENAGKNAPPGSEATTWVYDAENSAVKNIKNTSNYSGMVTTETSQSFKLGATLSSNANDDDLIGLVAAYVEEGGVPTTYSVVRAGGFNGDTLKGTPVTTWAIIRTTGNSRTVVLDGSSKAPNLNGMVKGQAWSKLGKTRVEIKRIGNVIEARTSQFSGVDEAGITLPVTEVDEATLLTFTLPAPFDQPAQYGLAALSQQNALFEDIQWAELPYPPVEPPEPDPTVDPLFERFPITYTVTAKSTEKLAKFMFNGAPLTIGTTFTNYDIYSNKLCVVGQFVGGGVESFRFTACVNDYKCTNGTFKVNVKPWPYPEVENNSVTMEECSEITLTEKHMLYTVEFGSTDEQIQITLDPAKTLEVNPNGQTEITPTTFTMADVKAGKVKLIHHCNTEVWREVFYFDICTQKGKCVKKPFYITITPIPVDPGPPPDNVAVSQQGCTYKLNFYGQWAPSGQCGIWTEIKGRVIPEPEEPGQIIYVPDALPKPVTIIAVPDDDGNLGWAESPIPFPQQPKPEDGCPIVEVVPNTDNSKSLIELDLWAKVYSSTPVMFDLIVGGAKLISSQPIDEVIKNPSAGSQKFQLKVPTAQLANGPVRVVFLNDHGSDAKSGQTRDLYVRSITVNGQVYGPGSFNGVSSGTLISTNQYAETPTGPYQMAPYLSSPYSCATDLKGTKWLADRNGQWFPVEQPAPVDWTPVIKAGPHLVAVDRVDQIPAKWPGPVYVRPENNVYTPVEDELAPIPNPFTETYALDDFAWIGANEYYLKYGTTFDIYFFSNRHYVRYDIMPEGGNQLFIPNSGLTGVYNDGILGIKTNNDSKQPTTRTSSIWSAMGKFPRPFCQIVSPISTMWDGMAVTASSQPASNDPRNNGLNPHHRGEYMVKVGGTESYVGFVASQRPVGVPEKWTGPRTYNPQTNQYFSNKEYDVFGSEPAVWSYEGFGSAPSQMRATLNQANMHTKAQAAGTNTGTYNPWLHFESWKINQKAPVGTKKPVGWANAHLSMLDSTSIIQSKQVEFGGTVQARPPMRDTTWTFRVRAYDIATGEIKFRTYKVHWNAKGTDAKGRTKVTTDTTVGVPGGFLPPKPKSAVCFFDDFGKVGNCKILDNNGK